MQVLYELLKSRFELGEFTQQRPDLGFISVGPDTLGLLARHLRDIEGFSHLVLLTAVDWIEANQFQLTYLLGNRAAQQDLGLRVRIPRDNPVMHSIHHLWPTAATYQRELYEMFGIRFPGSPRLEEAFILEGWHDLPPYRRDFDTLAYAQATYRERPGRETRDPAEHMKSQLYPGDD